ncbi:MAG: hypothetical protein HRT93_06290 [Piscirickettsiaceae bacterium]|nr:hypothetical protein [Piscirickettsiaceae bacterium]
MNQDNLNIAFEEHIDEDVVTQLKDSLLIFRDDVDFHALPEKGPQASILLLMLSSVAIVFGTAFVKKLGDKAAEDSYPYIKKGLSKLYKKYFGGNSQYQLEALRSRNAQKKAPYTKYSLILSLYCVGQNNERVKFLYETNWSEEEFDKATMIYIESIIEFVNEDHSIVKELIASKPSRMEPYLIALEPQDEKLIRVSALPEHVDI